MNFIEVGCAIVRKEGKFLIAQRREGDSFAGYWEFPGGKCEANETMEACIVREIKEELDLTICATKLLCRSKHVYPTKKISLHFYLCDWISGEPRALECQDFRWIVADELKDFKFPEGDEEILRDLVENQEEYFSKQ